MFVIFPTRFFFIFFRVINSNIYSHYIQPSNNSIEPVRFDIQTFIDFTSFLCSISWRKLSISTKALRNFLTAFHTIKQCFLTFFQGVDTLKIWWYFVVFRPFSWLFVLFRGRSWPFVVFFWLSWEWQCLAFFKVLILLESFRKFRGN